MLIYEILIELYVLSCVLVCCVFVISFKGNFLEDGHNRWAKHAGSNAFYNTVNLHVCICTWWSLFLIMDHKCMVMNHLKYTSLYFTNYIKIRLGHDAKQFNNHY